ncbi:MAG: hypothetical protein IK076_01360 [Bacteroidales bacterium]|nr:hypothetical protein [Bacteroidales bacterium]
MRQTNFLLAAVILLCAALDQDAGTKPVHAGPYKVTLEEYSKDPVSPILYGNFIELGYGIQVEAMYGEMFFNRSFEPFFQYRTINKLWYDLYYDERDPGKGYEKDWSKFDWYHSGYEHNSWYAAPGNAGKGSIISDEDTFFIESTPDRKVTITPVKGGSGHGKQCLVLKNSEPEEWGALAQDGKFLRKGKNYIFHGMIKSEAGPVSAEIRFYPQGEWKEPLAVIPLDNITEEYSLKEVVFENDSFDGYATFSLWIPPKASVTLDDFSLKASDNYHGWRPEAVEAFKQVAPKVVRFPGGCFASFYDWREGVGPLSERVPTDSYFWGGLNYNDVGTAEFAMLCKAAGAEMQMCVNVHHPSKRQFDVDFPDGQNSLGHSFPKFMSLIEGARSAADWVAYCNLPAGSHPMADLRASHGYKEPFGVKYWELDNEVHRWFEAEDYAWAAVVYSREMKKVDPTIQIGLSSYGGRPGKKNYHEVTEDMLAIAGKDIDFLADRGDASRETRAMIEKVRKYNAENGTSIKYCDTEWLAYNTDHKRDSYNMAERGEATKSFAFSKWLYALNLMKNFMGFQRMGDEMLFVNFNNLANTHSQCVMDTPKEGAYLTASGRVMQLLSNSPASRFLKIEGYDPGMDEDFQVQAAWDRDRKKLVIFICNRTGNDTKASFDISDLGCGFKTCSRTLLIADGPMAMNTLDRQDAIRIRKTSGKAPVKKQVCTLDSPAWSVLEIILQ